MNNKLRLIALFLSVIMLLSTFVSCDGFMPGGNETPDGGNETPDGGNETPDGGNETPDGGNETPDGGNETPDGGNETPDGGNETPDGSNENPDTGDETHDESNLVDYTVTIVDGLNNPFPNAKVIFTDAEGNMKERFTNNDGIASLKGVEPGAYTIKVEKWYSSLDITEEEYQMPEGSTSICLVYRNLENTEEVYGNVDEGTFAYRISAGEYVIPAEADKYSYFIFTAATKGTYNFSVSSSDGATVGYFGNPMFVIGAHIAEGEYDGKSFTLEIQDISTPYVIAVNSPIAGNVNLVIERIADSSINPSFVEWIVILPSETPTKCDLTGKTLVDLDIASETLTVSLGDDGYYYTNDGKLVYLRISTVTGHTAMNEELQTYPILGGSIAAIGGLTDATGGSNIGGYIYDEDGNFVEKHRYNDMIGAYLECVDATYGVVPLNAELAECIKLHGEHNGWWDVDNPGYLFDGIVHNADNDWLFLCMVEE